MSDVITKEVMTEKLTEVMDPELNISIVDLGLVYDVTLKGTKANVTMTLTTMGCPLFDLIQTMVEDKLTEIDGVESAHVDLTFEPPWTMEMLSERAKAMMGI